jgi:tetratricopeptide (TPR) repeat protein
MSRWRINLAKNRGQLAGVLLILMFGLSVWGADLDDARQSLFTGDYTNVIKQSQKALSGSKDIEEWSLLLVQALQTVGHLDEARQAVTNSLAREPRSLRLMWQARQVMLSQGLTNQAAELLDRMLESTAARPWAYRDASNLVVFGRAALLKGGDPKRVLDKVYEAAKQADPNCSDVYLASGELALSKHDYAMAAKVFQEGLKKSPDNPDFNFGLAQAYEPSDRKLMLAALESALKRNPRHIDSLLLLADHLIDAEAYAKAEETLGQVLAVNPDQPTAWAYRAVLAHLRNQPELEVQARGNALKNWASNPAVDQLIGLKLSQKYLFQEGSQHQRQALEFAPAYVPAKAQLAQDLLRLGDESTGWRLIHEVHDADGYDVTAYNLVTLLDTMKSYRSLTNDDFIVRMSPSEADIFGDRVLDLLGRAKKSLVQKYGFSLDQRVVVEVFPESKDFEIRTFGLPDNPGYLGVCFGQVITANSPAANPGHPVNWEAMLWHEFCHVVTLGMTQHKMPRWLSEGISVFEETQANPSWGQHVNPQFREMLLGDDLVPVSQLSSAFLAPESPMHLQFAYLESALVVDFMVRQYGIGSLKSLLHDLGEGTEINQAIERRMAPLKEIDRQFAAHAKQLAKDLAPGLDFTKPKRDGMMGVSVDNLVDTTKIHPNNYWALLRRAQQCVDAQQWQEAKIPLQKLIELYPSDRGANSAYRVLAKVHRALGELKEERQVLTRLAEIDDEALDAYLRLEEAAQADKDWPTVIQNAKRALAVNPLIAPPYRGLAQASEAGEDWRTAAGAYRTLLLLDPPNPAEVHFMLARVLHRMGSAEARLHVLSALEDMPRNREALRLLLAINQAAPESNAASGAKPVESR